MSNSNKIGHNKVQNSNSPPEISVCVNRATNTDWMRETERNDFLKLEKIHETSGDEEKKENESHHMRSGHL